MLKHVLHHSKNQRNIFRAPLFNKLATSSSGTSDFLRKSNKPNLTCCRNFQLSTKFRRKIFIDTENDYAFQLLPQINQIQLPTIDTKPGVVTSEDFERILNENWRLKTGTEIVSAFENLKTYCITHDITISDKRFDKLVDGLMDHCEKLTDEELMRLLNVINEYPPCDGVNSHNFQDIWSCLDDICCWKIGHWNLEKMFLFSNLWYKLNLGRISDFIYEVLDRLPRKAKRMSKEHLLYTFFYINVCRRKSMDFEYEYALAQRVGSFSVNELGIIAMAYFKSQSKVKPKEVLLEMIKKVSDNYETVNEITLSAILKTLRLSKNSEIVAELDCMLDKLSTQIPRLSLTCCLHIALIGTMIQYYHPKSLKLTSIKILENLSTVRIKEIERILLACSMFNFEPTPDFYEKCAEELQKSGRRPEFVQYNRCLPCALNYLSLKQIYCYNFMDDILQEDFINETYGKSAKLLPRELFSLDTCIEIECSDYRGTRLSPATRYKAAKWQSEYFPTVDWKKRFSAADKFMLDLRDSLIKITGDERFVKDDHVLPHFAKADLIICREKSSGKFVEVFGFENYILGDVKRPFSLDRFDWFAFVGLTPNVTIRNTSLPLGTALMKERQLKALGYFPIFVAWNNFVLLSEEEKLKLIKDKMLF